MRDLLFCAKHLFIAARRSSSQRSLTGHLDRGTDGVFEIVRVVGRGLISIAEVHAVVARAHLAQGQPEMSRNREPFSLSHIIGPDLFDCARDLFDEAKPRGVLSSTSGQSDLAP